MSTEAMLYTTSISYLVYNNGPAYPDTFENENLGVPRNFNWSGAAGVTKLHLVVKN